MVLARLSDSEQSEVAVFLKERRLAKGKLLFSPEDSADGVYFLKVGRLGVLASTGFEDKKQVVALLDPGSPIGEKGLSGQKSRGMTVVALEDSELFHLSAGDFAQIEMTNPALAIKLLKLLLGIAAMRLQANSVRLAHVL